MQILALTPVGARILFELCYRQSEVEDRSVAGLAGNAYFAAMGFDDCLGDRQTHAGALHLQALIATSIELLEYEGLFEVVDAGSAVSDAGHHHPVSDFSGDLNRRLRR